MSSQLALNTSLTPCDREHMVADVAVPAAVSVRLRSVLYRPAHRVHQLI